ncbi:hypothetical protein [Shewanella benthica]|uniref:Uncharacterized protein n=1 Tax=Shewanella benthica KT99 TaxID=314608 RepID=A9DIU0_9GAMM|nr:hypothetical protein [Shewanella benthica]EDP99024.1 hypothetical protein KT99_19444 [Shewanella benthica KT99]
MYNTTKTPVWYGELRTARGNAIVIHDKQFPEAKAGRIYLYNAVRDTIIEYAEEIVSGNLHDLDKAKIKAAEDAYGAAWDSARSEFMEKHQGWVDANATKHKPLITKAKAKSKKRDEVDAASSDNEPGSESLDREFANDWSGGLEE